MTTSNPLARTFKVSDPELFKYKMLDWIKQFNIFCFLDNHGYRFQPHRYEIIAAAGVDSHIEAGTDPFETIDRFAGEGQWTFGHISYEQGAGWLGVSANRPDPSGFPAFFFFRPLQVLLLDGNNVTVYSPDPGNTYNDILAEKNAAAASQAIELRQRLTKEEYIEKIVQLKAHIQRGDCYEINFCQEFFAENVSIDPVEAYRELSKASPTPFAAFYRVRESYLLCASPERFIYKEGDRILSQPMKGTSARSANKEEDAASKAALAASGKDKSENVMVVDLVRNDLSHFCKDGTVEVDELFGVYSFPRVHQMVSTVSGQLESNVYLEHIMKSAFPMGSMTGAPKKRVVELIREYEPTPRGIFSGTVGYADPAGNFDWNVVIRSIMYHSGSRYLSYQVGSGITFHSDPQREWEECLLKGEAIKKVLTGGQHL